jgi:hypothetical protein
MNFEIVKVSKLKSNPENPRIIKNSKFDKLVQSILEFPKMLEIRPIVVNSDFMVLGGNQRLKAIQHLGLKEVPVIYAEDLTEQQQRQFTICDNSNFGEWNWEKLANEWDSEDLEKWGLDLVLPASEQGEHEPLKFAPPKLVITFETEGDIQAAQNDIQEILDRKYKGAIIEVKL